MDCEGLQEEQATGDVFWQPSARRWNVERTEMKLHSPAQVAAGALLSAAIVVLVFQLFGLIGAHI